MGTATPIKDMEWRGNAKLYKLNPPLPYEKPNYETDGFDLIEYEYVIVSAAYVPFDSRNETFMFPAREDGEPISMLELPGSEIDTLSHERVLANAGYKIAK